LSHANQSVLLQLRCGRRATCAQVSRINGIVGSRAGYLPDDSAITAMHFDLPEQNFLPWGPSWLRGWQTPFFAALFALSIALKWRWRLH